MFVRCPFCHKLMLRWFYEAHARKHTRKRPDGQMHDHFTNAPDKRYRGSLDGVPRTYRHGRCGGGTGMPEEIIRSYLVNPLLYNDRTFCCRCGDYVDSAELTWVETGENLMTYKGRLRAKYLERVLGISRARQREEAVVVTPAGAAGVHQLARKQGLTNSYYFLLEWKSPISYFCCVAGAVAWNPRTRVVLESSGVQVLVPQAQVERLRGTIVDYRPGPEKGFVMMRLYLPQLGRPS